MKGGKEDSFHRRCTVKNLYQKTRISPERGIKKNAGILHAGTQRCVCAQKIRDDVELLHTVLF